MPKKNKRAEQGNQLPVKVKAELLLQSAETEQTLSRYILERANQIEQGLTTYEEVGRELRLTEKQIKFCMLMINSEYSGNQTQCYIEAYEIDRNNSTSMKSVNACAYKLCQADHPCVTLINIILSGKGFNQYMMDLQLLYLAMQKDDKKASILAIAEYNKLAGRTTKRTVEVTHSHKFDWDSLNKTELKNLIQSARKALIKPLDSDDQPQ